MARNVKEFYGRKNVLHNGKNYVVLVFGELFQTEKIQALLVQPVATTRDGEAMLYPSGRGQLLNLQKPYEKTRGFNMGWSICSPEDKFDMNKGIELCRRRYAESPITTKCGRFLTKDMVQAIVNSEVEYIAKNIGKYVKGCNNENVAEEENKNKNNNFFETLNKDNFRFAFKELGEDFKNRQYELNEQKLKDFEKKFEKTLKKFWSNKETNPVGPLPDGLKFFVSEKDGTRIFWCAEYVKERNIYKIYWRVRETFRQGFSTFVVNDYNGNGIPEYADIEKPYREGTVENLQELKDILLKKSLAITEDGKRIKFVLS